MKPKAKQQKEEEALRLLEEQKKKEEGDRIQQEEQKKYKIVTLPTQLQLTFTDYFIQEAMIADNCTAFTSNYITQVLTNAGIVQNFRAIDLQNLVDELIYDMIYAKIQMNWDNIKSQVFINIFYEIYKFQNTKFTVDPQATQKQSSIIVQEEVKIETAKQIQSRRRITTRIVAKSKESDWQYLKQLVTQHSSDEGENAQKYFSSSELHSILDYARKTYFAHHSLIQYSAKQEQRPLEIVLTLQVEKPSLSPSLASASNYIPQQRKTSRQQMDPQGQMMSEEEEVQQEVHEPTDEELLEPEVLAMIRDRLQTVKDQLGQKLEIRKLELNDKIEDLQALGKKGKK